MSDRDGLRMLGSPDVRNAVLLNEIGVLLHGLGKLSKEFISGETTFPHHLILRRLSRGLDPYLGKDASPFSAIRYSLARIDLGDEEKAIAHLLSREMADPRYEISSPDDDFQEELEEVLTSVREKLAPAHAAAFDQVAGLVRDISSNLRWQREAEEAIAGIQPPFISVQGFYDGLDELPFVADLVEMQGRTWHPEALLSPEVKLLRAVYAGEELVVQPEASVDEERLGSVRQLYCEVLANQFLEIYNIRKDGPGDLGSWFWKGRLYPRSEEAMALLRRFDEGMPLDGEELETVRWLGVRPITGWAYSKVVVGRRRGGKEMSLWEHSYELTSLHKPAVVQALIEGPWPEPPRLAWRTLHVSLEEPAPEALGKIKELIEVEYPLGNELCRDESSIRFTFPGLENERATQLGEALREEILLAVKRELRPQVSLTPIVEESSEVSKTSEL
jgi:hypothetical protein